MITRLLRRAPRGDDGQMVTTTLVFLSLGILAVIFAIVLPYGAATDAKAKSRTAADAASLAGAEAARTFWVDVATAPGLLPYWTPLPAIAGATGQAEASAFAAANGANLTSYALTRSPGRVTATVDNQRVSHNATAPASSRSVSQMAIDFGGCRWIGPPPPPPPPVGPASFTASLSCGSWSAGYTITYLGSWMATAYDGSTRDGLYGDLEPKLVR